MSAFSAVLEEGELEAGAMRAVDVDGVRVLVSRSKDGGVCAIASACTHVGGPLDEGERDGNVVACPWHGSRFDLCSGEVLRGPATEPQRRFESRLREGRVEVRLPQRPVLALNPTRKEKTPWPTSFPNCPTATTPWSRT
jgi:nitrite reductase/ring-hydroxylating ferredoxin subunit